jgi:TonB family protein
MNGAAFLLETTVRSSLVLSAGLAAAALLRRRSAALRHWILVVAIASAAAMPLVSLTLPSWQLPVPFARSVVLTDDVAPAAAFPASHRSAVPAGVHAGETSRATFATLVVVVWLTGAAIGLLILIAGFARLAWLTARARPIASGSWAHYARELSRHHGLRRTPVVLQSDRPALLVTWGGVHPVVIVPRGAHLWSDDRVRVVLGHELAHVKRADWLSQLLAEILAAVQWFNPLARIARRRLRLESEHAADDLVLGLGIDPSDYARHLMDLARNFSNQTRMRLPAPAIVRRSSLERRVVAMLNTRSDRAPATRRARLITVAVFSAAALAIASAQGAFSTLSGSVVDPQNGVLPDVTMVLTNAQSGAKYEIRTDRNGHFEFVGLPPGRYSMDAALPGFAKLHGTVDLNGQNVQRDIVLNVGSVQETITVRPGSGTGNASPPARRAAPAPKPCGGQPAPGAIGGNLRAPMKLVDVRPIFPPNLAAARTAGSVLLEARIGTDGLVHDLRTISATHPDFERAARDAVSQWEFSETLLNCTPVDVTMHVTITFEIGE